MGGFHCFPFLCRKRRRFTPVPVHPVVEKIPTAPTVILNNRGVPILDLPLNLLERIVTKVDPRSYFRIQQTSEELRQVIRNSFNIRIVIDIQLMERWAAARESALSSFPHKDLPTGEAFYSCRIPSLAMVKLIWYGNTFDQFCNELKRYRVTCDSFEIKNQLTKKECLVLLNILKPVRGYINSENSDRYEALLEAKLPNRQGLRLSIEEGNAISAMKRILPSWKEIRLYVVGDDHLSVANYGDIIKEILKYLSTESLPKLRKFHLSLTCNGSGEVPSSLVLVDEFRAYRPYILDKDTGRVLTLRCHLPNENYCVVSLHLDHATIQYVKKDVKKTERLEGPSCSMD